MSQRTTTTILWCVAIRLASLAFCNAARAHDAFPPPKPSTKRNVLMLVKVKGGHMVDMKTAKSLNANVINVAAVPHGVGTWIGSVKPLPAYQMGMSNGWKADLDELNKAGIAVWTSFNTTAFEPDVFRDYG